MGKMEESVRFSRFAVVANASSAFDAFEEKCPEDELSKSHSNSRFDLALASVNLSNFSRLNKQKQVEATRKLELDSVFPIAMEGDESVESLETLNATSRKMKKSVRFAEGCKTWDGTRAIYRDFDELLFCFLIRGRAIGDSDILRWANNDLKRILTLCSLHNDLIYRVSIVDEGTPVPCLPKGGGRALRIEPCYLPFLENLFTVLLAALKQAICLKQNEEVLMAISCDKIYRTLLMHFAGEEFVINYSPYGNHIIYEEEKCSEDGRGNICPSNRLNLAVQA